MAVGGIGPGGGAGSALLTLRLALRKAAPGAGSTEAGEGAAPAEAPLTPDAVLQDVVARAQFTASLRVAQAAVETVNTTLQTYDAAQPAPA